MHTSRTRAGRLRRPVALATAAVVAAMLIPAGTAVADDAADPNAVTDTQPVADPQPETPPADPQPDPEPVTDPEPQPPADSPDQGSTVPAETAPAEEQDAAPATDAPTQGDSSDTDAPADTDAPSGTDTDAPADPVAEEPSTGSTAPDQDVPDAGDGSGDTGPSFSAGGFRVSGYALDQQGHRVAVVGQPLTLERTEPVPAGTVYEWDWRMNGGWRGASAQFTPEPGDVGKELVLTVVAYADGGYSRVLTESLGVVLAEAPATGPVTPEPTTPGPTTPGEGDQDADGPVIHASDFTFGGFLLDAEEYQYAVVGRTLSATPGPGWAGTDFDYDWYVGKTKVSDDASYVPRPGDVDGGAITVEIYPEIDGEWTGEGIMQTLADYTVGDPDAPVDLQPMPQGSIQLDSGNGYQLTYGRTYTATPVGFAPGADYVLRWTIDGVQVGEGRTFTPSAGQIGRFVELRYEVRAEGYQELKDSRSAGFVQAEPTVTVSAPTITAGSTATVTISATGPAKGPEVTGPVDLLVAGEGVSLRLSGQWLEGGVATYRVPDLAPGSYRLTATYAGDMIWARSVSILGAASGGYTSAEGAGTLTVLPASATVTAPATLTVPVAMRSTFEAEVSVPGSEIPDSWTLREGGTVLSHGSTRDGRFAVTVPVLGAGTHTLVLEVPATAWSAAASTTVTITVVGEPVRTGTTPSAVLDTPKAATAPGQQMELVAEGFQPGETVAFYLHSDPVFLGTAVAGADGVARLMATVPGDVPAGAHTVYATGGTTGRWATLAVQLAVPVPTVVTPVSAPAAATPALPAPAAVTPAVVTPAAAGELAATGSEGGALGLAAAFLVAVGGALVLVTRRVRALR